MTEMPIFRDVAHQTAFDEQGFVIVPLLTPEEAVAMRRLAASHVPDRPAINDPQDGMYNSLFDAGLQRRIPNELDELIKARFGSLIDGYRSVGACIMAKVADSGRLAIHQHQPETPDIFTRVVHLWLTLEDVDASHAALRVVPRSQRILRHIQSFQSPPYFVDFRKDVEEEFATIVPMRAGEAIFMDGSLLHGSCPNRSDSPALRVFSILLPEDQPLCILAESEGHVFDAYAVEGKTFDPGLHCIAGGSLEGLVPLGRLDNRNTRLTRKEFEALIRSDERIGPGVDPIDAVRARLPKASPAGWLARLHGLLNPSRAA